MAAGTSQAHLHRSCGLPQLPEEYQSENLELLEAGCANMQHHIRNVVRLLPSFATLGVAVRPAHWHDLLPPRSSLASSRSCASIDSASTRMPRWSWCAKKRWKPAQWRPSALPTGALSRKRQWGHNAVVASGTHVRSRHLAWVGTLVQGKRWRRRGRARQRRHSCLRCRQCLRRRTQSQLLVRVRRTDCRTCEAESLHAGTGSVVFTATGGCRRKSRRSRRKCTALTASRSRTRRRRSLICTRSWYVSPLAGGHESHVSCDTRIHAGLHDPSDLHGQDASELDYQPEH